MCGTCLSTEISAGDHSSACSVAVYVFYDLLSNCLKRPLKACLQVSVVNIGILHQSGFWEYQLEHLCFSGLGSVTATSIRFTSNTEGSFLSLSKPRRVNTLLFVKGWHRYPSAKAGRDSPQKQILWVIMWQFFSGAIEVHLPVRSLVLPCCRHVSLPSRQLSPPPVPLETWGVQVYVP